MRIKDGGSSNGESQKDNSVSEDDDISKNDARLIDWNVGVLRRVLQQMIAQRKAQGEDNQGHFVTPKSSVEGSVLDEVQEVIKLPAFDLAAYREQNVDSSTLKLSETVETQLHLFVSSVCRMYHPNPFHNFEHASHVTMSVR